MAHRIRNLGALGALTLLLTACTGAAGTASPAGSQAPTGPTASPPASTAASATAGKATCEAARQRSAGYSSTACKVAAPALAGNKLGSPAELSTVVWLPPGYEAGSKRYPSVYVLAGYTEGTGFIDGSLEDALAKTAAKPEAIFVMLTGLNALGGSFYVNSPVTGNWEDAVVTDLVGYVDASYRTLPAAKSRGIAGTSMGGFGALNLAMRHADVFGAVYAFSPGLFDPDGAEMRLGDEYTVRQVLAARDALGSAADASKVLAAATGDTTDVQFEFAYGMAFAPDPSSPVLMRLPFRLDGDKVARDAEAWKVWEGGFGGLPDKIAKYGSNLKSLRGIAIDYGTSDGYPWIPKGGAYFVKLLGDAGIQVTVNVHDGGHEDRLTARMAEYMLPFMVEKLAAS